MVPILGLLDLIQTHHSLSLAHFFPPGKPLFSQAFELANRSGHQPIHSYRLTANFRDEKGGSADVNMQETICSTLKTSTSRGNSIRISHLFPVGPFSQAAKPQTDTFIPGGYKINPRSDVVSKFREYHGIPHFLAILKGKCMASLGYLHFFVIKINPHFTGTHCAIFMLKF